MRILIADIPDEGLIVDTEERLGGGGLLPSSRASCRLSVSKVGEEIVIAGNLKADLQLQCSRCLKEFTQSLDIPVNVVYHPVEEVSDERHGLRGDELDMGFYRGEEFDLTELLTEQILLNSRMKPLCDEGCKGICPKCGLDLNTGQCGCREKTTDPRLEVLRKFLDK